MVQNFAEMPQYPSEEIFAVFICAEQMCDPWTTSLLVDCHVPHASEHKEMTK